MYWALELKPWHESSCPCHPAPPATSAACQLGGLVGSGGQVQDNMAEAGLKQAGLHRKVQLYPELASACFCTSFCAKITFWPFVQICQNVRLTNNHVQQHTMLGVAALASMLLQICTLKKSNMRENECFQLIDLSSHAAILLQVCTQ